MWRSVQMHNYGLSTFTGFLSEGFTFKTSMTKFPFLLCFSCAFHTVHSLYWQMTCPRKDNYGNLKDGTKTFSSCWIYNSKIKQTKRLICIYSLFIIFKNILLLPSVKLCSHITLLSEVILTNDTLLPHSDFHFFKSLYYDIKT